MLEGLHKAYNSVYAKKAPKKDPDTLYFKLLAWFWMHFEPTCWNVYNFFEGIKRCLQNKKVY
jgi:hypothetical protein